MFHLSFSVCRCSLIVVSMYITPILLIFLAIPIDWVIWVDQPCTDLNLGYMISCRFIYLCSYKKKVSDTILLTSLTSSSGSNTRRFAVLPSFPSSKLMMVLPFDLFLEFWFPESFFGGANWDSFPIGGHGAETWWKNGCPDCKMLIKPPGG